MEVTEKRGAVEVASQGRGLQDLVSQGKMGERLK
jgi:hypothetical protein